MFAVSQNIAEGGAFRGPSLPVRVVVRVGIRDFTAVAVVPSTVVVALQEA